MRQRRCSKKLLENYVCQKCFGSYLIEKDKINLCTE